MHISILCIGKMDRNSAEQDIIARYITRLPWKITIIEQEIKDKLPDEKRKAEESKLLLQSIKSPSFVIALDERGKTPTTKELSQSFARWQEQGHQQISFLIGGASGHAPETIKRADYTLSLSALTWPHMLVRAMLLEQLYRVHTVLTGHPYHK